MEAGRKFDSAEHISGILSFTRFFGTFNRSYTMYTYRGTVSNSFLGYLLQGCPSFDMGVL
jgi:hypothetical protein